MVPILVLDSMVVPLFCRLNLVVILNFYRLILNSRVC